MNELLIKAIQNFNNYIPLTDKFYGKLTLNFENGKITLVRDEMTIKPIKEKPNGMS